MPSAVEVRYPEESRCVVCGRELAPGTVECTECAAASPPAPPVEPFEDVERHLRRSRGRILVGLLWIWFLPILPWAYLSARAADRIYRDRALADPDLLARIGRHKTWAVIAILVWLAFLLVVLRA